MEKWKKGKPNYHNFDVLKQFHRETVHLISNTSINTRDNVAEASGGEESLTDRESIPITNGLSENNEFERVLKNRRTSWAFKNSLDFDTLSRLLSIAFNVTEIKEFQATMVPLRAYPSAGASYSISIYVYINHVHPEMNENIYKYDPDTQALYKIKKSSTATMNNLTSSTKYNVQDFSNAKMIFFLCSNFKKLFPRYGLLTYRLSLLEAGHMAHNLQLASTYLGLSSVPIGGFYDLEVNKAIPENEEYYCLYINAIG
ncbi:SagB-type dehydrogenase domain-containing protein [Gracilibacillus orientalis]|uniref:SagB-type dehydrogenase domain-containing protein n=1 Tax=Gracilibacillus orientalis TaxID=334253 RepID=A0A1I4J6F7_9BACI|nr:SagB/ThcOx family dehydrogenase [Gracilibacillus orientalis]SFL62172.1 SagB-type dehydrogenase domain-containing protein [Gracilibacillus orientalis]